MPSTLELGNLWYCFYVVVCLGVTIGCYFPLRKASKKAQFAFVMALSLVNLAVHFLKMLLPEYRGDYPMSWRKCTFENICAVSVLIFPFVMISKSDTAKDYIVFLSVIGGLAAIFVPTGAWGYKPFRLESIRFYLSHVLLLMQGSYAFAYGLHRPSYKRLWKIPFSFFMILGLIALNELVLRAVGFTDQTLEDMILDPTERNSCYIFGLTPALEEKLKFITVLVPDFMKHGFGYRQGDFYWPWVWTFCPIMVYGEIIAHVIGLTWGWKDIKKDIAKRKEVKTVF